MLSLYPGESEIHFLLLLQDLETWCEDGKMLKNLESDEREDWDEGLESEDQIHIPTRYRRGMQKYSIPPFRTFHSEMAKSALMFTITNNMAAPADHLSPPLSFPTSFPFNST